MNVYVSAVGKWVRKVLLLSLVTVIFAQASLHIVNDIFIISLGTICLPAFVYLLDNPSIIAVSAVSGVLIVCTRILAAVFGGTVFDIALVNALPEILFYLVEGLLLFIFDRLSRRTRKLYFFIPGVMVVDYISNAMELFSRIQEQAWEPHSQYLLVLVALIRGTILLIVLLSVDRYRIMLLSRTHAERYNRLIMLTSKLKGELVWMNKNIVRIEDTMSTAYSLYEELSESGQDDFAKESLSVAKDVHEVKKEYLMISRGITDAVESESENEGMQLSELFIMLTESVRDEYRDSGKNIIVLTQCRDKLYTKDPYLLLSVFHNLIANAVEASRGSRCTVIIEEHRAGGVYVFNVRDNGPGVAEEYRDQIFEPRFSTKINYDTGEISRGLGLCIVKDIIEKDLGGEIRLAHPTKGAEFVISVPEDKLQVIK
ncbi:MAG: sensor histidine kinase [Anaerovoracaceae bacterium]|nr:sensor histidine kinase [Bacillota bacterium]MDY2670567.1 sensor histidine kinase [Anaerovoracaceae bacterium]